MREPGTLLLLSSGARETRERFAERVAGQANVAFADLQAGDLDGLDTYGAIFVGCHVDQRRLATQVDRLAVYLEHGGTVVANGHVAYPFLPGLTPFRSLGRYKVEDLEVRRPAPHPVFDGVAVEDLTSRRGVVGFYARGWHAPPAGARILHTIGSAELPVDFVYRVGSGRVLFHGGNDLWTFAADTSTRRLVPQLLAWALFEEQAR